MEISVDELKEIVRITQHYNLMREERAEDKIFGEFDENASRRFRENRKYIHSEISKLTGLDENEISHIYY